MKNKNLGFGLFLIYLALFVLDMVLLQGLGTTTDLATIAKIIETSSQIGLAIRFIILIMFGLLLTSDD